MGGLEGVWMMIEWLSDCLIDWWMDWLIDWMGVWAIDWLSGWVSERLYECVSGRVDDLLDECRGWSIIGLIVWLIDWLLERLINCLFADWIGQLGIGGDEVMLNCGMIASKHADDTHDEDDYDDRLMMMMRWDDDTSWELNRVKGNDAKDRAVLSGTQAGPVLPLLLHPLKWRRLLLLLLLFLSRWFIWMG